MFKKYKFFLKYEELIIYFIVGILTTIVSWTTCWIFETTILDPNIGWQNFIINLTSWIAGVLFGYVTNRKYVFKSTNPAILKEFIQFSGARVSTLILDIVIMHVTVNRMHMNFWISKLFLSSVLVMIVNYVFSKLLIFQKKEDI